MRQSRPLMGMPITIEIVDAQVSTADFDAAFDFFTYIDETFSTYKEDSEISRINRGELERVYASHDMQTVFELCAQTQRETNGYFDICVRPGVCDPSGLVKGWSIFRAAELLYARGLRNFFIDAGGDVEVRGFGADGEKWCIGIQNPFAPQQIIKVVSLSGQGIATSGTYVRGQHIYNPHARGETLSEVVSLSVIGPNIYEADRFVTAAFAMGRGGIEFIERLVGFEGYMIDMHGVATQTSNFENYVYHD